jgi:hypothetical protein
MTVETVEWLTAICLLALVGRALYIYMEWHWRTRLIRTNDQWLAQREQDRKGGRTEDHQAA